MARTTIGLGAAANDGGGDDLRTAGAALNANIAKDDKLQTATGLTEGSVNIGSPGVLPTTAPDSADTLLKVALAAHGRLDATLLTQSDAQRTARELTSDYAYKGADESLIGTTNVTSSGTATSLEYPGGSGIYTLEIIRSGGAGGSEGRTMIVRAVKGDESWLRLKSEGVWGDWQETNSVSDDDLLTTADATRTATALGSGYDWRTLLGSGYYRGTWDGPGRTTYELPSLGAQGSLDYDLLILRTGELTGWAVAGGHYANDDGDAVAKLHIFRAPLTLASSGATSWTVGTWEGITPRAFADRSIMPAAMYDNSWLAEVPTGFSEDPDILPLRIAGRWTGHVSALSLFPAVVGQTYYVDRYTGNNANAGTSSAAPLKSIATAMQKSDAGRVLVAPGIYHLADGWGAGTGPRTGTTTIRIEKWQTGPRAGDVIITNCLNNLHANWSANATYSWVYEASGVADVDQVLDLSVQLSDGSYHMYAEVGSVAACSTLPGSYYFDSGANVLYAHGLNRALPGEQLVVSDGLAGYVFGADIIMCKDLKFVGGMLSLINDTGSSDGMFVGIGCDFVNSTQSGVQFAGIDQVILEDCRAIANALDGMSFVRDQSNTFPCRKRAEIRTTGVGNGHAVTPANSGNATTTHYGTESVLIDCFGEGNVGPQFADVIDCVTWALGCRAGTSGAELGLGVSGGFAFTNNSTVYLYECSSDTNEIDLLTDATTGVYVDQCSFRSISDPAGQVRIYRQL